MGRSTRAARSRRPSAAAAASSRCAGARGRAASRRRSLRAAGGPRRRRRPPRLQYVKRPLADVGHVGAQLGVAQDRQLAARPARVLDRVVEAAEVAVQRLALADRLHQPELLEVGDVPEIPGQRAEHRRVDPVELLVVERLDQPQGALLAPRREVPRSLPWSCPSPRWRYEDPTGAARAQVNVRVLR